MTRRLLLALCLCLLPASASAQGVGVWMRPDCTTLTAPVTGQTWCFDTTASLLKVWTGAAYASIPVSVPVPVASGGTGASGFTSGSMLFMGAGGTVAEDNADLRWDDTYKTFVLRGAVGPSAALDVRATADTQVVASGVFALQTNEDYITAGSGAREAFHAQVTVPAGSTYSAGANGSLVAASFQIHAATTAANVGYFGSNPVAIITGGTAGQAYLVGEEIDVATSVNVLEKLGLQIVQMTGDTGIGTSNDAALFFRNQAGAVGWNRAIEIRDVMRAGGVFLFTNAQTAAPASGINMAATINFSDSAIVLPATASVNGRVRWGTTGAYVGGDNAGVLYAVSANGISLSTSGGSIALTPTTDIQWGVPLVALGATTTVTLGKTGGAGPATVAQNTWMRVVDSTGAPFWVPAWK